MEKVITTKKALRSPLDPACTKVVGDRIGKRTVVKVTMNPWTYVLSDVRPNFCTGEKLSNFKLGFAIRTSWECGCETIWANGRTLKQSLCKGHSELPKKFYKNHF